MLNGMSRDCLPIVVMFRTQIAVCSGCVLATSVFEFDSKHNKILFSNTKHHISRKHLKLQLPFNKKTYICIVTIYDNFPNIVTKILFIHLYMLYSQHKYSKS